ncbi:MAG: hypothetical protein V4687_16840 [Bacteroidota bacterium]
MTSLGFRRQLELVREMNSLLETRNTGSLEEIALALNISEELAIDLLVTMIKTMGCPVMYDSIAKSYYYNQTGKLQIDFVKKDE